MTVATPVEGQGALIVPLVGRIRICSMGFALTLAQRSTFLIESREFARKHASLLILEFQKRLNARTELPASQNPNILKKKIGFALSAIKAAYHAMAQLKKIAMRAQREHT